MTKAYNMLIRGKWLPGRERLEVKNPYNGEVLGTVPIASKKEVDAAIEGAQKAFYTFSQVPAHQRAKILETTSNLINERKREVAETLSKESGKPIRDAIGEVSRAVQTFKFAAEEAKQIHGHTIPMDAAIGAEKRIAFYQRFPIGIIGAITPFNFPLNLVAHKVAPAIAAGNTVVLKPASATPLTSIKMGEIMIEAGLPEGALNIVFGPGSTVGEWIVSDPRPAMISLTGSPPVGHRLRELAGLKRVTLELGSNSAVIVEPDTDLDVAVPRCVTGAFAYAGQICISVQRIYVHQGVFERFRDMFLERAKGLKVGDPMDETTDLGPMITENDAIRAESWIKEATRQGAELLIGGERKGNILEPTVLTKVKPDMKVSCIEIFAPVVTLDPYQDFDQALDMVNNSIYGLQAGVYTNDVNKAFKAFKRLHVGGVMINDIPTFRVDHMPYGGVKESGTGREGLKYAVEEMTEMKLVVFNLKE